MKRLNCFAGFPVAVFIITTALICVFNASADENINRETGEIEMFYCPEQGRDAFNKARNSRFGQQKLVYGFVNGRRTDCMTETEFRSRFYCSAKIPVPPSISVYQSAQVSCNGSFSKNYSNSDFRAADLFNMDFQSANCRNTDFSSADMRSAKMQNADCQNANFEGAFVKNANLSNADLSGANLKNTYFVSSDLRGVKGLTIDNIRIAATVYNCKLDPDIRAEVNKYCPSKYRDISQNWGLSEDDPNVRVRRVSK